MAKFTANVILRDPDTQRVVTFREGDDVPAWAGDLGDHVATTAKKAPAKQAESK